MLDAIAALNAKLNVLHGILYQEPTVWHFILVNVLIGGGAAWMTGKSCAKTWRPMATCLVYLLLLSLAVRFIHFALFETTLLSFHFWLVDLVTVQVIGFMGFRATRDQQMQAQYGWLRN